MLLKPKPFKYLDIIHLVLLFPLATIIVCLLVLSVLNKLNDCSGFYTRCQQISNQSVTYDWNLPVELTTEKDLTVIIQLLLNKARNLLPLQDGDNATTTTTTPEVAITHLSYDWVGLDQFAIVSTLLILILFGSISALLRRRRLVFIAILIYLLHLTQLALIEASDDRDFPASIFRDGHTVARYSIIYTDNTIGYLAFKICFLILISTYYILLTVYFVLLRYKSIYQELERYN